MSLSSADSAPDTNSAFNMEASTTTTARINKFDGMNFHIWKFKMQMVLEERGLCEVTSGGIKMEQLTSALDQTKFKRKSRKPLTMICLEMKESQLPLVRSASGALDASRGWKDTSRRRTYPASSFFFVVSSRPRWRKVMMCLNTSIS